MRKIWRTGSNVSFQERRTDKTVPALVMQLNANGSETMEYKHSVDYIMLPLHDRLISHVTYVISVNIYIARAKSISSP